MKIIIDIDDEQLKKDMTDSEVPAFDDWTDLVTKTIKAMCFPNIDFQIQFTHVYYVQKGGPYSEQL